MSSYTSKLLRYTLKQSVKTVVSFLPPRIRFNKAFWDTYHFLQISRNWSAEKLKTYQTQQLHSLLIHAYANVPYYTRMFDEHNIRPRDISSLSDLQKLPLLDKETIRLSGKDFIASNYPQSDLYYNTTGGSSGEPLGFYEDKRISEFREYAFILTMWERIGFRLDDKRLFLRGGVTLHPDPKRTWDYRPLEKTLFVTSHLMTEETMPEYIRRIRKFSPDFLHVYPSNLAILADYMHTRQVEPFQSLKGVLCASEKLYPWQRDFFREVFQCQVHSFYGHTEKAVLAGECELGRTHLFPEYGITELVDQDGRLIETEGQIGEIVATGFNNFVTPFIRYRTGDMASWSFETCDCGLNYPILKEIEGRSQEFLVGKNGELFSLNPALYSIHDDQWTKIKGIQFVQEQEGELIVRIVKQKDVEDSEIQEHLRDLLTSRFHDLFEYTFVMTNQLQQTGLGKHKYLIQKLPVRWCRQKSHSLTAGNGEK